jgi:hypothetical protein
VPRSLCLALLLLTLELAHRCGSVPAELKGQRQQQQPPPPPQPAGGSDPRPLAQRFQTAASVPLADAAAKGDIDALTELLRSGEHPIDQSAGFGMTPLHLAAGRDRAEAVALLLAHGASPGAADARGWTPLHLAASRGAAEATMQLLQGGADAMTRDNDGNRAAALAQQEGYVTLARVLGRAEGAAMRLAEEEVRSSVARAASLQLPAATLKAAAATAAATAASQGHQGAQPGPAAAAAGVVGGARGDNAPDAATATANAKAERELLHQFVPRGDDADPPDASDPVGASAAASPPGRGRGPGSRDSAGSGGSVGVGDGVPSSAAPTDVMLPSLTVGLTAHHKVVYHAGADGTGEMGVSVEPTDHTEKLLGRAPTKIAQTRDKVSGWFSSPDAAQHHAKQFAAAKAEAAAERESRRSKEHAAGGEEGEGEGEGEGEEERSTTTTAAAAAAAAAAGSAGTDEAEAAAESATASGQAQDDAEVEAEQEDEDEDEAAAEEVDGEGSKGQQGIKRKKVKDMDELLTVNSKTLHTLPRLSNDTVIKRRHHHAEDKPKHAPARHAELVAAALAAQDEAVSQGLQPTRGLQHPAIQKMLEKKAEAPYGGEGGPVLGEGDGDKMQTVRAVRTTGYARAWSLSLSLSLSVCVSVGVGVGVC